MITKPAFTVPQKFFDFRIADPVVLVVIKDRDEYIEMRRRSLNLTVPLSVTVKYRLSPHSGNFVSRGWPLAVIS